MATFTPPQTVDFANGQATQMGSDNYDDYSASSAVTFPTGSGDHISTSAGFQTVHVGNQTVNSQIELTTPVPELYLGFWMKFAFDTFGADDSINMPGIFTGTTNLFRLVLNAVTTRTIALVQATFRNAAEGTTFRTIGGSLFYGEWHHVIMRYKHGLGDGILSMKIDAKTVYEETGLTLSSTVNADRAGVLISGVNAANDITVNFDHLIVSATEPPPGDRANLFPNRGMINV